MTGRAGRFRPYRDAGNEQPQLRIPLLSPVPGGSTAQKRSLKLHEASQPDWHFRGRCKTSQSWSRFSCHGASVQRKGATGGSSEGTARGSCLVAPAIHGYRPWPEAVRLYLSQCGVTGLSRPVPVVPEVVYCLDAESRFPFPAPPPWTRRSASMLENVIVDLSIQ